MLYLYFLSPIGFILVGLIPILLWKKHGRTIGWHIYGLGWLAWFCAVSVKFILSIVLVNLWPFLFSNTTANVVTVTLLETTEVISAYLFLRYHPSLKQVREWNSIVAFGLGFGCGEAITIGIVLFHWVDIPLNLLSQFLIYNLGLGVLVERMSTIFGIHLVSAIFIAFFLINKKPRNILLGILSKDLSATLAALWYADILPSKLMTLPYIELMFAIYALIWLLILYLVWRKEKIRAEPSLKLMPKINKINFMSWVALSIILLSLWGIAKSWIGLENLATLSRLALQIGFFFLLSLTIFPFTHHFMKSTFTESLLGAAFGSSLWVVGYQLITHAELLSVQLSLTRAMIPFFGVLCALAFYEFIRRYATYRITASLN
jgi:hypothetical protein